MNGCRIFAWTMVAAAALAGGVVLPSQTAAQRPSGRMAITPARIAEIIAYTRRYGSLFEVGPRFGAPLGLTAPVVPFRSCHTITTEGNPVVPRADDRRHSWIIAPGGRIIAHAGVRGAGNMWLFDLRGNLLNAAMISGSQATAVPVEQARAGFDEEMRTWATVSLNPIPDRQPCSAAVP